MEHQYFAQMSKDEAIKMLAEHERNGTLQQFIASVAPNYILPDGSVAKFELLHDLETSNIRRPTPRAADSPSASR